MSSDVVLKAQNVGKRYEIYEAPHHRLFQTLFHGRKQFFKEFWALRDVSFEVKRGECIGIIGRNGSGKSTLLQIIAGTLAPTLGNVEVNGRVSALLELGSGFNPEFTGRENVYMNGAIMGFSKAEMDSKFDEITAFADIGDFIEQPVKTYSSGMYVRLAYAVIAHVGADILVIDEALAVGDIFFQQKCMHHLRTFQNNGGTVMFVSHDTAAVTSLCNRAILLSRGEMAAAGKTDEICKEYIEDIYAERTSSKGIDQKIVIESQTNHSINQQNNANHGSLLEGGAQPENMIRITPFRRDADSFGQGGARIVDAWFEDKLGSRISTIRGGDSVNLYIRVELLQNVQWPAFGFILKDRLGQYVIAEGTDLAFRQHELTFNKGDTAQVKFSFLMPILFQGEYLLTVAFAEGIGDDHIQHHWVNDAMILYSLKCRLVHGICGLHNLSMGIQIFSGNKG